MIRLIKSTLYILVCMWVAAFGLVAAAVEYVNMGVATGLPSAGPWWGWLLADLVYAGLFALMAFDKVRSISFTPPPKMPMISDIWIRGGKRPGADITR